MTEREGGGGREGGVSRELTVELDVYVRQGDRSGSREPSLDAATPVIKQVQEDHLKVIVGGGLSDGDSTDLKHTIAKRSKQA